MNKAIVQKINYAGLEFEGLMLPDGSYRIGLSQLYPLLAVPPRNASRTVRRLLGKEFQFLQVQSELNPKKVNTISLEELTKVIKTLAKRGEEKAWALLEASFTEKIERIFDAAFGKEVEEREREAKFKARLQHKKQFRPKFTDWLKADGLIENWEYGKAVNQCKAAANLPLKPVEEYSSEEQERLNEAEVVYNFQRRKGLSHYEALSNLTLLQINNF